MSYTKINVSCAACGSLVSIGMSGMSVSIGMSGMRVSLVRAVPLIPIDTGEPHTTQLMLILAAAQESRSLS